MCFEKSLHVFCSYQPYDETQFYICCEQCEDWFHGRCVGIMQVICAIVYIYIFFIRRLYYFNTFPDEEAQYKFREFG